MIWVWRILGGLIGVLLLAALGLWAAGFRRSAGKVTASVEIDRPVAHVWRYLTDDTKVKSWVGGLLEIRPEAGTPSGVGWRARMVVAMGEQRFEGDWETTAFEEHKHIGFVMKSPPSAGDGFVETGDYHVEELGGLTRVTLSTHSQYAGWFHRLLEPVISASAQKKINGDLQRLKTLAEAEPIP